jgi:nuclear pore complex protein Nup155
MTSSSADGLEVSGRHVEKMLHADSQFPSLVDKLRVGGTAASLSGLQDPDYPALNGSNAPEVASLRQMSTVKRVPLPAELVEHFGHMQCNCMMGLFTEVERAWLTIDSDIYVWK